MASYNFHRVLIEVVTARDVRSAEEAKRMIQDLAAFLIAPAEPEPALQTAVVCLHEIGRAGTLEQLSHGPDRLSQARFNSVPKHAEKLQSACVQLGLQFEEPNTPGYDHFHQGPYCHCRF